MLAQIGRGIQRFFAAWYRFVTTRKTNAGTAVAALGSLFVVCCVGLFIIGAVNSPRAATGTATGVPAAQVPTLAQSTAAAPTPVPTEAIATTAPEPTALPTPTNTPEPPTAAPIPTKPSGPPPEVQAYAQTIAAKINDISGALTKLGSLMQNPQLTDDDWRLNVAVQLFILTSTHDTLAKITPPAEMREIHIALLDATSDCKDAANLVASGMDNNRVKDLQAASRLINQCGTKMTHASDLTNEYMQQFK